MANKERNINEWIEAFDAYKFHIDDLSVQIDAGWYDWFCKDSALKNKTVNLGKKVKQIAESSKVDKKKMYVFFKNNCPMNGPLYDDFRFCDIAEGNVQYTITPRSGHNGMAEVWGRENDFAEPLVQGTWKDVKEFFKV